MFHLVAASASEWFSGPGALAGARGYIRDADFRFSLHIARHRQPKDGLKCSLAGACWADVDAPDTKLSFEDALVKLETIVESMESGEVPLAELLAKFEEGTKLLKVCESRLKDAELKIEQLKKQKDGSVTFEKFEASRED